MRQKGFAAPLIILGAVILIAITAGVFYLQSKEALPHLGKVTTQKPVISQTPVSSPTVVTNPTPTIIDETANPDLIRANWKTYTDKINGFSISYPNEFISNQIGGGLSIQKGKDRAILFLQVSDNKDNLTAKQFFENQPDQIKKPMLDSYNMTNYELNGYQGLMFTKRESLEGYKDFAVSFSHNKHIYDLNFGPKVEESNLANQILATFKFLN